MKRFFKRQIKNILFLILLALLIIPQTRQPIQVFLNKGLALFAPSVVDASKQKHLTDYTWTLKPVQNTTTFNFETTKGKVVLVNFWATWCPPCIAEMPSLQALYNTHKDNITFVFVSNEDTDVISKFITKEGYTLPVYQPLTNTPKVFDVKQIPRTFLIDKNGNIIIDKVGAANWNSDSVNKTIQSLLQN